MGAGQLPNRQGGWEMLKTLLELIRAGWTLKRAILVLLVGLLALWAVIEQLHRL
jgi:hypothetical protein